jgi:hypothetical protein
LAFDRNELSKLQHNVDEEILKRKVHLRKTRNTPYNERASYGLTKYVRELMKTLWDPNFLRNHKMSSSGPSSHRKAIPETHKNELISKLQV